MKYSVFPGTRTAICTLIFTIALFSAFDVWGWIDSNYSGFIVMLSGSILTACVFYAFSRCLIPAFGLMSVHESVSLYWASLFFFYIPLSVSACVIELFEIESPYLIGFVYFLAIAVGVFVHMAWNVRAFRSHKIVILKSPVCNSKVQGLG
jgi:hypothetical protein